MTSARRGGGGFKNCPILRTNSTDRLREMWVTGGRIGGSKNPKILRMSLKYGPSKCHYRASSKRASFWTRGALSPTQMSNTTTYVQLANMTKCHYHNKEFSQEPWTVSKPPCDSEEGEPHFSARDREGNAKNFKARETHGLTDWVRRFRFEPVISRN